MKGTNPHMSIEKEFDKTLKELKRAQELKRRNAVLTNMIHVMRSKGASEQSIQKALQGIDEFAKFAIKPDVPSVSDLSPSERPQPTPTSDEILGQLLSDVHTQAVHWLWEKRIPRGKITILDGDPGMGKSMLAIALAACVSTGRPMPDGTPCQQGGVILIAPEDGAGDTLRPRLQAAGGDPSHVLLLNTIVTLDAKKRQVVDRPFSLSRDLPLLEAAIERTHALLVILDPLMAVLGHTIDSSRDQDIREVFTPLSHLAERSGCAILIIRHLSKGASENALYRGAGAIGIIAAARVGLLVAQHPHEENTRILATTKNNLSRKATNLSYQIAENESGIPYIQWLGENNYTLSTLLESGTNMSIERQKVLQILKDADSPLSPQEVAERTGQTYLAARLILIRMHEANEISRPSRGQYTSLHQPQP